MLNNTEPVFVNLLRSPGIDSQRGGCTTNLFDVSACQSPNFLTFKEPRNRFQGINSASQCILAGRYDNHIPTRFLAPIVFLKLQHRLHRLAESIPWLFKRLQIRAFKSKFDVINSCSLSNLPPPGYNGHKTKRPLYCTLCKQ